ncbi:MAG TPA: ferrochelatase [Candidatus Paceibacterota bacterium]|nr:ferrochelatase [Candidatus Paceibacterota bacterium]
MSTPNNIGVLLMTYGSATIAERVEEYMNRIYAGKASRELIEDFQMRYRLVGHSPLIDITRRQAALVQERLGNGFVVRAAMRHSQPFISEAVTEMRQEGVQKIAGIILSPQFSSFIMEGYRTALFDAAQQSGFEQYSVVIAKPWPAEEHFVELLAHYAKEKLSFLEALHGCKIPIVFTTHSLPERVVKSDPSYLDQLKATTDAVLAKLSDNTIEWYAGYQSAGHTPEKWLKPDLTDILKILQEKKSPAVLIVPIQFLADHLEILYDLDIAGAQQCAEHAIAYNRIELPNTDPLFIESLSATISAMIEAS